MVRKWNFMTTFKDFTKLNKDELEMILKWRNDESVNRFFIKRFVEPKEHFNFVEELKHNKSKKYFLVLDDEKPIGVVNFININKDECEFGLYQNPKFKGYGKTLLKAMLSYAFETLKVKTIKACVYNENKRAIALFLSFDFVLYEKDEKMSYFTLKKED